MSILNELVAEICAEEGIGYTEFSHGYVLRLTKGDKRRLIYGFHFDVNGAAADLIAGDKVACYSLLTESGVPAIEHKLFFNPRIRANWLGEEGGWRPVFDYFETNGRRIVAKLNKGTQGRDVYLCEDIVSLERAVQTIFTYVPDVALSPFYDIETEYRVFVVQGQAVFAYGKLRGEESWKHNLSQGAQVVEVADDKLLAALIKQAEAAAAAIGISFCTVDIADTHKGLLVMEINSGVATQKLVEQMPHLRGKAKEIYAAAIHGMFS